MIYGTLLAYALLAYFIIGAIIGIFVCYECNKTDSEYRKFLEKEKIDDVYDSNKAAFFSMILIFWLPSIITSLLLKRK